jgi:hypothetical protein
MPRIRIEDKGTAALGVQRGRTVPGVQPAGFLAAGVERFDRVVETQLGAAR